jgi:hypothetical protein
MGSCDLFRLVAAINSIALISSHIPQFTTVPAYVSTVGRGFTRSLLTASNIGSRTVPVPQPEQYRLIPTLHSGLSDTSAK